MTITKLRYRLRELLVVEGLVSPEQISQALDATGPSGGHLLETLIELGHLDLARFEKMISGQPGVVSLDLGQYRIDNDLMKLVPAKIVRAFRIFPIDKLGPLLTIGMSMPIDSDVIGKLEKIINLRIKAVYCSPAHIDEAISKYYKTEGNESSETPAPVVRPKLLTTVPELLRRIDDLPALPETVTRTREALSDPSIEMGEIETLINRDPLVSSKLLKLANSAAYSFSRSIDNVGMAIRMLGLNTTYNLIVSSAVLSTIEDESTFNYNRFVKDASFTARSVDAIAKASDIRPTPAMSTAGLLHDIGRFAIAQATPEAHEKIDSSFTGKKLIKCEEAVLGLNHAELGHAVLDHWNLPEEITSLVRFHHKPERAESMQPEANVLTIASYMAENYAAGNDLEASERLAEIQQPADQLGLKEAQLIEINQDTKLELAHSA